jgi:3-oxoacyl-[acyl-carrier protein] reductase
MDLGLEGRVAVVLGSTSGLGRATAQALADEGAHVVIVGRRAAVTEEVASGLPSSVGVVADITEPDAPERIARAAREAFGRIDVLVLNGGGPPPGEAEGLDAAGARSAIELLLAPHVAMVGQVLPAMREAGWGRILAVGSSGVQQPIAMLAPSNIGRAALAAYLKSLAGDVARDGVTVNMVLPGRIDTERVAALDRFSADRTGSDPDAVRAASEDSIPVGRYGRVEEFAAVLAFLASDRASYVTGEQVRCDGGMVGSY